MMCILKKWNKLAVAAAFLLTLLGCAKPQILDGPGMVNDRPWREFTLSRADSYAQYNFWFTVQDAKSEYLLTGECRDEDGNEYIMENGVPLSEEDAQYLRDLWLAELSDAVEDEILLDAPQVSLVLTWNDGTQTEKALPGKTSIELYHRFLPYFKN